VLMLYVSGSARTTKTGDGTHKDTGGQQQGPGEPVASSSVY
jgi:hypothetical protein